MPTILLTQADSEERVFVEQEKVSELETRLQIQAQVAGHFAVCHGDVCFYGDVERRGASGWA